MGLDLEFERMSVSYTTELGQGAFWRMYNRVRDSLKTHLLDSSYRMDSPKCHVYSWLAGKLTTNADIEKGYNSTMQAFAERFEWEVLAHTEPGQENDPVHRMRVMERVMEFQDHTAQDLWDFMESGAYQGYQRHGMKPQRHEAAAPELDGLA